jgi:hypothetical protein
MKPRKLFKLDKLFEKELAAKFAVNSMLFIYMAGSTVHKCEEKLI